MLRRIILCLVVLGMAPALAADFPTKPIRMIVGFVPGGGSDLAARVFAQALGKQLGQAIVIEYKPGAGSVIGVDYVAKSPPDGYTLVQANAGGITTQPAVKKHVPYSVPDDFSYISEIVNVSVAFTVNPQLPIHSMAELIAYARANPGKLRYGTPGVGSSQHMLALLLQRETGIEMTQVPYRGSGSTITDLLGGFIDLAMPAVQAVADQAEAGKVRVIAVSGAKRERSMPDVPTMAEAGLPQATVSIWYGLMGPAGLPPDVLARLRIASAAALNDPETKERFEKAGFEPAPLLGDDFKRAVAKEFEQWKGIAAANHISID